MPGKHSLRVLYAITLLLAACSLLYELLIAQTLTMLAANMVVWYSVTVGTYLLAMGVGALLCERLFADRDGWNGLYWTEVTLSVVGGLAVVLLHLAHILHAYLDVQDEEVAARIVFFGTALAITFVIGIFTGYELPLLIRLGNEISRDRRVTNRVLGVDYIGALGAGIGFPLLLLPNLELFTIGFVAAAVNLLVAVYVLFRFARRGKSVRLATVSAMACMALLGAGLLNLQGIEQYFLQKYYYYYESAEDLPTMFAPMPDYPRVFRDQSYYQKIDIVRGVSSTPTDMLLEVYSDKYRQDPGFPRNYHLFLNGDYQLNSDFEEIYHEYLAHVPVVLDGEVPEHVLILGAGDGCLAREIVKYGQVKEIVLVDIDPKLLALAKEYPILTDMNYRSLDDPRLEIIVGDAYQYLRKTDRRFDGIYIDFPYVLDYNVSKLYSAEFYHFLMKRIADDGFAVLDSPGIGLFTWPDSDGRQRIDGNNDWPFYRDTLEKAGFGTILPYASNLELDNPAAYEALERFFIRSGTVDDPESSRKAMRRTIIEHVMGLQYGFIYMRRDRTDGVRPWRDPGVNLWVLNEERYRRAFQLPFPARKDGDPSLVNSIMRPTLPNMPFWFTRLPW